jgi:hypothetical protein
MLDRGLEAATVLPASEVKARDLKNCRAYNIATPPLLFFPSIVKMTTSTFAAEVLALLEGGVLDAATDETD